MACLGSMVERLVYKVLINLILKRRIGNSSSGWGAGKVFRRLRVAGRVYLFCRRHPLAFWTRYWALTKAYGSNNTSDSKRKRRFTANRA